MYRGIRNRYRKVLVIYDISDQRRRYRVVKILESYGNRIQESAFECVLLEYKVDRLINLLKSRVKKEDCLRIYHIDSPCFDAVNNRTITETSSFNLVL